MCKGHHVVTGAFGYSGAAIASRLLEAGHRVVTLTNHPRPSHPLWGKVEVQPLRFDAPDQLRAALGGAAAVYNTYWIRFDHGDRTHARAVENSEALFQAAAAAGVGRFVHISITNPDAASPLPYFSGKARLEASLRRSGLSHAILRPTVLFGGPDVLINNIAWLLRRVPVFGIASDGAYPIQPVHVEDLARLAVQAGRETEDQVLDAVGPEVFTFRDLVLAVRAAVGSRAPVLRMPPWLVLLAARLLRPVVKDVLITADEIQGLMAGLLRSDAPATGELRFSRWLEDNGRTLGRRYASELARHY